MVAACAVESLDQPEREPHMLSAMRWRGPARSVAAVVVLSIVFASLGSTPATAAEPDPPLLEGSTTLTQEETVTVTETATVDGYEGHGTASATASATATGTARAATWWEVNYWSIMDAYEKASAAAKAKADAEARPIAKQRAEDDARAKAAAGPVMLEWSTTWTQEETVTVDETATVDGFEGRGSATATASATATGTAKAETWWELNYYAVMDAYEKASAAAKAKADAEARPIAKQRAEDDARAKAAAGPVLLEWSTTWTQEETVTVTESATVDGFEGYGTATATASATATGTAKAATQWELYYYATMDAYEKASAEAKSTADAEARALALQRAQAAAQAKADAVPDPEEPATGPSCGPAVLKSDGTPWTCTLADEFRGTALDTDTWSPVETATSRFTYGDCLVPDNVKVQDGTLRLTTRKLSAPVTCEHPDEAFDTSYTSGSVTSLYKFSQTYGRFEIRAAMPTTSGAGLHSALWLVPDVPTYYGGWPRSGEIDIAEFYSSHADRLIPALHYESSSPWNERTNNECKVYKPTAFHTYAVEWTEQKLTISIDGTTCLEHAINPAVLTGSAPFDRPFNINLTQMLGFGDNALPAGADIDSATMQVDYVHVWR
jgi:predicted GNAT family acetyltransferase